MTGEKDQRVTSKPQDGNPLLLELREHTEFRENEDGTWSARVAELGLQASGPTKDAAFEGVRAALHRSLEDKAFKRKFAAFMRAHGAPTTREEYDRRLMDRLRRFDEPISDPDRAD